MKFTILRRASLVLVAAFAIHYAQAHGSQGYAPDAYYRITDATDLRLGIALGVIGAAWSWLRIKM
jgi:hypothetical protein